MVLSLLCYCLRSFSLMELFMNMTTLGFFLLHSMCLIKVPCELGLVNRSCLMPFHPISRCESFVEHNYYIFGHDSLVFGLIVVRHKAYLVSMG
ncbi:hypothetical protein U1Q18_052741 [Sarracenia purpurea var. burkii]